MSITNILTELLKGAEIRDHSSGGKILVKYGKYLEDTFLSPKQLKIMTGCGCAIVGVAAIGLIWRNWDWIKTTSASAWKYLCNLAASAWESLCNIYEATSEFCTSTLDAAWNWFGFEVEAEPLA